MNNCPICLKYGSIHDEKDCSCPHCGGSVHIANPTGKCNHVYYPDNPCKICKEMKHKRERPERITNAVRTLLADEEFCERMARELFCQFEMGDGNLRERCEEMWDSISPKEKSTTANWIADAKEALRNAAG